ncbi:MAG: iron ABC transporter substrate-binding protein [Proteobacteria bacterium]|nr:MAG: iron ABC transporter substrate-binding protein [Pseudomonadota bacterium]
MQLRPLYLCLGAFLMTGLLSACSSDTPQQVNVYSARKAELIEPLLKRFTADTGIQVNLVTGKADALIQRLKAEGRASPADLLITVDAGRLYRAKQMQLTQTIEQTALTSLVPGAYRDPEGHWLGLSLRARPIMYARDRVSPDSLSTYEALADEHWHGRVCIRSSNNIYNQSLVASMIAASGIDAVEQWAGDFVDNFARNPVGGDRDQIKAVAAGQCDVAVANTYYLLGMLTSANQAEKHAAQQVSVFWPNQGNRGTHVNISGIAMTQSAKNIEQAQQLMTYLLQPEAQAWYAQKNGEYPVIEGPEVHPLLQRWGNFKKDNLNVNRLGELNTAAVQVMDRAGWR